MIPPETCGGLVVVTPVHAAMLAVIHAAAFAEGEAWGPDAMALLLEMPGVFGLMRPGAGLILARLVADEAEVVTLAVVPAARRQGEGRRLLAAAMAAAARAGAAAMLLEVSAGNPAALALYTGAGFVEAGRRRHYYADGTDALVMRSPLGTSLS